MRLELHGFDDWIERERHVATELKGVMNAHFRAMTGEFHRAAVEPIRDITAETHGGGTDRLALSAAASDDLEDASFLKFNVIENAKSEPNMDGTGGGFEYVQMVLPPEWTDGPPRRIITAPSMGPYSTGKRAFAGPEFGPVHSFMQYGGDPFPLLADDEIKTRSHDLLHRYSDEVLREVFRR